MTWLSDVSDEEILPQSLKHNFWTWSAQGQVSPIPVARAQGCQFWDVHGKRYLDFNSMVMCSNIGHGDKRVIEAMVEQARELTFAGPGMATRPRAALGTLLAEITPGDLNRFLYTLGGADANEHAIKIARAFTGRHKIGRRPGRHRRSAPHRLGTGRHARRRPFPRSLPLSLGVPSLL
jgi:taurine--2-oxoglutarate transaminase